MVKKSAYLMVMVMVLALVVLLGGGLKTATAQSSYEQLSGRFDVMWGDPEDGNPITRYGLVDSEGRRIELAIDEAAMSAAGGLLSLNRQPVVLTGNRQGPNGNQAQTDGEQDFRVHSIQRQRQSVLSNQTEQLAEAVVSGSQKWVTVLCRFGDSTGITPHEKPWFDTLMLGGSYPGMDHYWQELSFNQINLVGSMVVGWYNLPQPHSYYVYDRTGDGWPDLDWGRAVTDCTAAADADVYFPNFIGINMVFNQNLDCCAWGGSWTLTLDGQTKGYSVTWLPPWGYENQAVIGHEMGHGFGLPHSSGPYNGTYDSGWDVMSSTWFNCFPAHPDYGCIGQHTISFHKDLLGWFAPVRRYVATPGSSATIEFERLALPSSGTAYLMAKIPIGGSTTQFYTVELRQKVGYDQTLYLPYLPSGNGIVIHRVDMTRWDRVAQVVDPDGNLDPNDSGAVWLPGETFTDLENQISVAVNAATATGFQVTITNNSSTPPTINVTPSFHDFGSVIVGSSADLVFTVWNDGGGILTGEASVSLPFSIVSPASYSLGAGESQNIVVRFTPSSDGLFYGSANFTGGGGAVRDVIGAGSTPVPPKTLVISKVGTGTGRVTGPGVDCGFDCQEGYLTGTVVSLTALADSGSVFSGWSGDVDCVDGILTMNADKSCVATFTILPPPPAPDLTGSISATQICRRGRCRITGSARVWNQGTTNAPNSRVRIVLSDDAVLDLGDAVLRESSTGLLRPGRARAVRVNIPLPLGVSFSGKYLFAVIDPLNVLTESNEANNMAIAGPIP